MEQGEKKGEDENRKRIGNVTHLGTFSLEDRVRRNSSTVVEHKGKFAALSLGQDFDLGDTIQDCFAWIMRRARHFGT